MANLLWHNNSKESRIISQSIAKIDTQILCKAKYSLISLGTERTVASGQVPFSSFGHMDVPYMKGDFGLPIHYGYSMVAQIIEENHEHQGKFVHLLHPHADEFYANEADLFYLEEGYDLKRASLISNVETAVNAIWDGDIKIGDKVLICGYGLIGALIAKIVKDIPGVTLHIAEKNDQRRKLALSHGFTLVESSDYDHAFNCSANEAGLQYCIDNVGYEGKIIELSWYGMNTVQINLGGDFHYKRKKIISSQVGHLPLDQNARWDYKRRKELVATLLKNDTFVNLIDYEIDFEESPNFFNSLRESGLDQLTCLIKYKS